MQKEQKNIYLLAMEKGIECMEQGITYKEMIQYLESINKKPKEQFANYFHVWFYRSFWCPTITQQLNNLPHALMENQENLAKYDDSKAVLLADSYSQYLDFLKLQQARQDAKKAHKLANLAIWISVGMAIIQISIELVPLFK